jgi:hypothetical protein
MMCTHGENPRAITNVRGSERLSSGTTSNCVDRLRAGLLGADNFDIEHGPFRVQNDRKVGAESVKAPPRLVIDSFALQIWA